MGHGGLGTVSCTGGCGYFFRLEPPAAPGGSWTKTVLFDFPAANYFCLISAVDAKGNFYGAGSSSQRPDGYICELKRNQSGNLLRMLWISLHLNSERVDHVMPCWREFSGKKPVLA